MLDTQLTPDWDKILREQGLAGRLDYCVIEANLEIEVTKAKVARLIQALEEACLLETDFVSPYSCQYMSDKKASVVAQGIQEAEDIIFMEKASDALQRRINNVG